MPKRQDIKTVMVLGSGPIVIGQACEFDYSGTQGCKALMEEGYKIVLLNSNPATVMTDPGFSHRTYMEPLNLETATNIIRKERPDALLPTLGGQTALNLAMELHNSGVLKEYGVEMIGARPEAIELAENRRSFYETMKKAGLDLPVSGLAMSLSEALKLVDTTGFPAIIRPSYTLGGTGGGIAYNIEEFEEMAQRGIEASPIGQVLIEESVLGWKEIELEVVRDKDDNAIIVCGIENFDPMGVHTGDSITVAPIQTMTHTEYTELCADGLKVVRAVGVDTGGCNIQFAVDPATGRRVVIEMNPRVSRSSALASKATGVPIARITTKLALGYTLDELKNEMTGTSACFEPAVDYCVVKVPRFNYEKFEGSDPQLGLQMHSVGETMALGRNFREALQKALRSLELSVSGLEALPVAKIKEGLSPADRLSLLKEKISVPSPERLFLLYETIQLGIALEDAYKLTSIDPWFLIQLKKISDTEELISQKLAPMAEKIWSKKAEPETQEKLTKLFKNIKIQGFSDKRIAQIFSSTLGKNIKEKEVRALRLKLGIKAHYHSVDSCAGEFKATTPYFYSSFEGSSHDPMLEEELASKKDESQLSKLIILGGGPNRIGQGVEFDYCCVQALFTLKELGITGIMINSNPETISTDFDTADRLYFEPVTVEDVLAVCEAEGISEGKGAVLIQFGGQTPLNIARELEEAGIPILGTKPDNIFLAEDREAFSQLVKKLNISQPPSGMAQKEEEAYALAKDIGYPVMVRPSFVLGGRNMQVVHNEVELRKYLADKFHTDPREESAQPGILIDKFLEDAVELDVDAVSDGKDIIIAAVMEHIEQAGIHSGDSCCSIPAHTLDKETLDKIRQDTKKLGLALNTIGLMNIQFAVRNGEVFILEANPRASRTVPFVSKASGYNIAGIATKLMTGIPLKDAGLLDEPKMPFYAVKEAVLPFERFPGATIGLGPEMRSTGEVMGIDRDFGTAFLKAQAGAGTPIPFAGNIVLTVTDRDKDELIPLAQRLVQLGFKLMATSGTRDILKTKDIESQLVTKIGPQRPNLLDLLRNGDIAMVVNTVSGATSARDATLIRSEALLRKVTLLTTLAALRAAVEGLEKHREKNFDLEPLQDYYQLLNK